MFFFFQFKEKKDGITLFFSNGKKRIKEEFLGGLIYKTKECSHENVQVKQKPNLSLFAAPFSSVSLLLRVSCLSLLFTSQLLSFLRTKKKECIR